MTKPSGPPPGLTPPAAPLFGDEHVKRYRETDGEEGYDWLGTTILLLTTTGRKSGVPRTKPLMFREWARDPGVGTAYLVVPSNGGSETPSSWWFNLQADPSVEVQIKGEVFAANARVATAEEKPPMWELMVEMFPTYAEFQKLLTREIDVVVLERAEPAS